MTKRLTTPEAPAPTPHPDTFLDALISEADRGSQGIRITVVARGATIKGTLVGEADYYAQVVGSEDESSPLGKVLLKIAERRRESPTKPPRFLHLAGAVMYQEADRVTIGFAGPLRVRVSSIDAWHWG